MRFCPPLAALASQPVSFDGDPAARQRPMAPLIAALRSLAVRIEDGGLGRLPFTVHGPGQSGPGRVVIDAAASSQFASALLLAAPAWGGLEVVLAGPAPSAPHIDMTLAALRQFGAEVEPLTKRGAPAADRPATIPAVPAASSLTGQVGPPPASLTGAKGLTATSASVPAAAGWRVSGSLSGRTVTVEPDLSGAAAFVAAAVATGGEVRVPAWPEATTQPGDFLRSYLPAMGAQVRRDSAGLTVNGPSQPRGADLDLSPAGELAPVLAALAAVADRPSRLTGIGHLRGHETDRLAALTTEINRLGGRARELPDGIAIEPVPLQAGRVQTYGDHRLAMFGAVIGLVVPGIEIEDIATTAKTMPDFRQRWTAMVEGRW
jgi:3-phosphoshikimate 1-carboxyvinyltransferase